MPLKFRSEWGWSASHLQGGLVVRAQLCMAPSLELLMTKGSCWSAAAVGPSSTMSLKAQDAAPCEAGWGGGRLKGCCCPKCCG